MTTVLNVFLIPANVCQETGEIVQFLAGIFLGKILCNMFTPQYNWNLKSVHIKLKYISVIIIQ